MNNIYIYWGPKSGFDKFLPNSEKVNFSELISIRDNDLKSYRLIWGNNEEQPNYDNNKREFKIVYYYSNQYAGITESAIHDFTGILNCFDIDSLYIQNPPIPIYEQIKDYYDNDIIIEESFDYTIFGKEHLRKLNKEFDKRIIGQDKAKIDLMVSLLPFVKAKKHANPITLLFYGNSGVGKTETAKFLSDLINQHLFRKQFSMFQNDSFGEYIFGSTHSKNCLARDLLERESNIILFDEFDKPNPVFFSAFYQLFDEGVLEDRNYRVDLKDTIIICTSNFKSVDEIRTKIGDPLFFRFDKVICFENLTAESVVKIIDREFERAMETLSNDDKSIVDVSQEINKMKKVANRIKDVRTIKKMIKEIIDSQLLFDFLKTEDEDNGQVKDADGK